MTDVFEELAGTRPRVKRDVLFTQTTTGVLFHRPDGGFRITAKSAYRLATLLVPYLDGSHRLGDLAGELPAGHRQMVGAMVRSLIEHGFAKDVPATDADLVQTLLTEAEAAEFDAQLAYIDHFENEAAVRLRRLRDARVAVVGDDLVAGWCALSLIRNGCARVDVPSAGQGPAPAFAQAAAEAAAMTARGVDAAVRPAAPLDDDVPDLSGYDVAVFTGSRAPHRIVRLQRAGLPAGITVLPVTALGRRVVVGPSMTAGEGPCWTCAALRMTANADDSAAAGMWARATLPEAGAADRLPTRHHAAMLGNLAGYEVFRLLTGAPPAETRGQVIVQDMDSLDVAAEPVHPHPLCPFCAAGTKAGTEIVSLTALHLTAPVATALDATDHQAAALADELARASELVAPVAGVFRAFDDDWVVQSPLKLSRVTLARPGGGYRTVAAFDTHTTAGARLRALRAAAAVYAATTNAAPAGPGLPRIDPASLATASGLEAAPGSAGSWVVATSLTDKREVLLPAAALHPFGAANADRLFLPSGGGAGVGASAGEAAYAGLFSALAQEALLTALRGYRAVRQVRLDALHDDRELRFLVSSAKNLDLEVELLDLTETGPAAPKILLARAIDPVSGRPRWAVGADGEWRRAAGDALRDLVGTVQLAQDENGDAEPDLGLPLADELDPWSLRADGESVPDLTAATTATLVRQRLQAVGQQAFAAYAGSQDLRQRGLVVLRVVLTRRPA